MDSGIPFCLISKLKNGSIQVAFASTDFPTMEFGLLLVDIARHYANALEGDTVKSLGEIFEGFDMERRKFTTEIERVDN